jgi:BirA family biotin operon repressor/biotin-[acetyl-CoA-carboxylase] ligase
MMDKLSINAIQSGLKTSRLGRKIILLETAASTNDAAWEYVGQAGSEGLCVLAEQQTAGRGRRGRVWHSQSGQSILCSLVIPRNWQSPSLLTLAVPVAVAESIAAVCRLDATVKWPNDVLLNGKKVAGILIESKKDAVVIGIGINVHQGREFFEACSMDAPATSLDVESGQRVDRNHLVRTLLEQMEYWLGLAIIKPAQLAAQWQRHNRQIGSRIELESDGKIYCGTCLGIDPAEGLIVQLDRGPIHVFSAATTTLIKNPAQQQ